MTWAEAFNLIVWWMITLVGFSFVFKSMYFMDNKNNRWTNEYILTPNKVKIHVRRRVDGFVVIIQRKSKLTATYREIGGTKVVLKSQIYPISEDEIRKQIEELSKPHHEIRRKKRTINKFFGRIL